VSVWQRVVCLLALLASSSAAGFRPHKHAATDKNGTAHNDLRIIGGSTVRVGLLLWTVHPLISDSRARWSKHHTTATSDARNLYRCGRRYICRRLFVCICVYAGVRAMFAQMLRVYIHPREGMWICLRMFLIAIICVGVNAVHVYCVCQYLCGICFFGLYILHQVYVYIHTNTHIKNTLMIYAWFTQAITLNKFVNVIYSYICMQL